MVRALFQYQTFYHYSGQGGVLIGQFYFIIIERGS